MCFYVICSNNKNNNKNGSRLKLLKNFLREIKYKNLHFLKKDKPVFKNKLLISILIAQ